MRQLAIFLCVLALLGTFGYAIASQVGVPIVNNGFEIGNFTGWDAGQGWSVVQGNAAEGNYSAKITLKGGTNQFGQDSVLCTKPYPANSNDARYQLSWKASASKNGYADFMVRFFDSNKQRMYDEGFNLTNDFSFRKVWGNGGQSEQYQGGSYIAFCVKAVAFQGHTFTVSVDSVNLSQ